MWANDTPGVTTQINAHHGMLAACHEVYHDLFTDTLASFTELAENRAQAIEWLNQLLHIHAIINYSSHLHKTGAWGYFELQTLDRMYNIPQDGIISSDPCMARISPHDVVYALVRMLIPNYACLDVLQHLYGMMITYPDFEAPLHAQDAPHEKKRGSEESLRYKVSTQMHAGRTLREFLQITILEHIHALKNNAPFTNLEFHPKVHSIHPMIRKEINNFLDIRQWEPQHSIAQSITHSLYHDYLSDGKDLDYYNYQLSNHDSPLRIIIQHARDYFGEDTASWHNFWHIMMIDPELFLEACTASSETLPPLTRLAQLMISFDDANPIYASSYADHSPIAAFCHTLHPTCNIDTLPDAFIAIARTRFLSIFMQHWLSCKDMPSQSSANNSLSYLKVIHTMNKEENTRFKPLFRHILKAYANPKHPSYHHIPGQKVHSEYPWFSVFLNSIKEWCTYLYNYCKSFFETPTPHVSPSERMAHIHSLQLTTDELKNLKAHGLIDTEDRKDIYSDKRVYHQSKIINDYKDNPSRLRH